MKKNLSILVSIFGASFLIGCGDPSVDDVCGPCSGTARGVCEDAYELCRETSGCDLDDLEEAFEISCGSSSFLTEADGGL
jgi:hypothetical protein